MKYSLLKQSNFNNPPQPNNERQHSSLNNLPVSFLQTTVGLGNPLARQWRATVPPRATLALDGSTTQAGGTAGRTGSEQGNEKCQFKAMVKKRIELYIWNTICHMIYHGYQNAEYFVNKG